MMETINHQELVMSEMEPSKQENVSMPEERSVESPSEKSRVDTLYDAALNEVSFLEGSSARGIVSMLENEDMHVNDLLEKMGQQRATLENAIAEMKSWRDDPESSEDAYGIQEAIYALEQALRPKQARYEELEAKYDLNEEISQLRADTKRLCTLETSDQEISVFRRWLKSLLERIRAERKSLASPTLLAEEQSRVEAKLAETIFPA